ncbi:HIT family hydrolase [Longibacter salinarum]|uniref:HIT family hydrolase n=1 Tax=Longibacter salinarum TaxID=1850348 RepID=A0A2A8D377_9BACT|nr:HIT domain-containing protein [Longibacter salinarum]PEN15340.1 HIT family hydrolase [Longibacter salinarum]
MDRLWSPWRSTYVSDANDDTDHNDDASVFTALQQDGKEKGTDAEHLILWRGEHVFVIMNLYPYNNGHLLIVPYREIPSYIDLSTDEHHAIADAIDRCMMWLNAALEPEGFNVGMNVGRAAGAGIPEHLHVHVVPRWGGDTNFMPTTNETKVLPESLRQTYDKLSAVIAKTDGS